DGRTADSAAAFTWLEQVIAANVGALFPGKEVTGCYFFRVTRNADLALREAEAEDLLETIEESLERRLFGFVVRLSVDSAMPPATRAWLAGQLGLDPREVHVIDGPLGLSDLMALYGVDRPDLKYPPFVPQPPAGWPREGANVLELIRRRDVLLHHPYNSFAPVVDFVRAATGPDVLAIKQTLYRVGANSPIVDALLEARDEETQVAVVVELKARFDEESNIGWARALEQAGVHVAYGLVGLKTHCKLALIVRRETDGLRRYAHLGTGNYNASTARGYEDFGLLTSDPDICADVSDLFNYLTGYSAQRRFRKLLVAPAGLRSRLVELIDREAAWGERGRLIFKMNALVDAEMVEALYRASRAGVRIDLIVRGACSLRPGVPGVSETIRVISIVGRFLEHSRAYYFGNGGEDELYLGSADLMPRNLNRRVEVLFPLEAPALKAQVRDEVLPLYLRDNVKARVLQPDGTYVRERPAPGEPEVDSQAVLLAAASAQARP
ncbi:MAG: polyphosphate kinase 1, partial [Chloroflexota bacterium]|nr:polyphosphate kinase 1 [Chloroflexota bacterium]